MGSLEPDRRYKLSNKDDDKPKGDDVKTGHMAPRHVRRKPEDGKYKDRAEMRRQGKDDEFKEVSCRYPYKHTLSGAQVGRMS